MKKRINSRENDDAERTCSVSSFFCFQYGEIVVSDEIQSDFVFEGIHHVFANLKEEYQNFTVTCTAPGKTFNLAGLQTSNIFIPNPKLRKLFPKQLDETGYSKLNAGSRSVETGSIPK